MKRANETDWTDWTGRICSEDSAFSANQGATYGATNRKRFSFRRPKAQPMAQPIGGRLILGGSASLEAAPVGPHPPPW
eukprot:9476033-Pyramimonas_sp.AAC.1